MEHINLIAVLFAAIATFVIGFLAHGPVTGALWMKLANVHPTGNEKFSDMYGKMFKNFIANIVAALGLALVYAYVSTSTITESHGVLTGVHAALFVWLTFIVAPSSMGVIWMGQSVKLWLFECAVSLVSFTAMGIIIATL